MKNSKRNLARPERFELPTYSSGGCRSIQLSYGRAPNFLSLQPQRKTIKHERSNQLYFCEADHVWIRPDGSHHQSDDNADGNFN
jgi:hypothetical protein